MVYARNDIQPFAVLNRISKERAILDWKLFMKEPGSVIGMPFSLEGVAFVKKGIFPGIYFSGWPLNGIRVRLIPAIRYWLSAVGLS